MKRLRIQGITLVEVLVGISILAGALIFITHTVTLFVAARNELVADTKATYLAEEGYELVRSVRDEGWSNITALSVDTEYAFSITTTTITVVTSPEVVDEVYRRTFQLHELYRDADDDIVASTTPGALADSEGREVWVTVGASFGTTTLRAVITNLFAS